MPTTSEKELNSFSNNEIAPLLLHIYINIYIGKVELNMHEAQNCRKEKMKKSSVCTSNTAIIATRNVWETQRAGFHQRKK